MTELIAYLHDCPIVSRHRPWPRVELAAERWRALVARLPQEEWELFALWGEPGVVHMCLRDPAPGTLAVLSLATRDGRYPSVGGARPGALRMERAARDLVGLEPEGLADRRDWLDHGAWPARWPLSAAPIAAVPRRPTDYAFLQVDGEGLHQIAVGPIHAGIIEPGHFRFHANGETVVRLEERLGYVHKGTEKLMQGRTVDEAAKLAGRISCDATVAHAIAFARAVEAALDMRAPARADALRGLMAELERIANHLGDFGAICNDAAFTFLQAEATTLREDVLRVCGPAFGHRLMMDAVVPGGVAAELSADGARAIHELVRHIGPRFDALVTIYDDKPSLLDRTLGTGVLVPHLAQRFAAGGHVGRASGRSFDSRKSP
ncbi:MAG: nickel-dependent hydrogenase large subunit, partial [Proteobacteria bacterium]|nr:nickel-dependent hydrogenase large subunit [Pseudomonadota bacterium]